MRYQLVVDHPSRQLAPLIDGSAIDRDSPFHKLVFAGFEVRNDFLGQFCQITTFDIVVGLQKDLTKSRLPNRIILEVKLIEAVK